MKMRVNQFDRERYLTTNTEDAVRHFRDRYIMTDKNNNELFNIINECE